MEDKFSQKKSHALTLSDFIERRKDWDQEDETRLAEYLQQLSNKITQGAKGTLNELDDLVASIDVTAIKVANINNEFQLLADKQFIENKVQEEDETLQTQVKKPVTYDTNNDNALVNNLKEALKNSFKAIDTHFEKVTVVVSDSDDDDDELKHEETILRPRTIFKKLDLPSLNGHPISEIAVDTGMSSDSDSDVENPKNIFKDEKSISSNDVTEEKINNISESKIMHKPNSQLDDIYSNNFSPEVHETVPTYVDNSEDDLFISPPLLNDNDEDNLDNEYNVFGNSNMYGERNLWDDNDDNEYSNEPPLPIYSDEPPQQVIKSNTQENVESPSIQQSLNDELRKRFHKDIDNKEPPKIKLPKGAVNILGGTYMNPCDTSPAQNIKQGSTSLLSNTVAKIAQRNNIEDVSKDLSVPNKLPDTNNPVISDDTNLNKNNKILEKRSLFEQDSDEEDLFAEKVPNVILASKLEIPKRTKNAVKNNKSSRTIFSEYDSDEEFTNLKTTTKKIDSCSFIDNSSTTLLDSSSEDDLFYIKSTRSVLKPKSTLFSFPVNNEIDKKSKSIKETNVQDVLNKEITNEQSTETLNVVISEKVIRRDSLTNNVLSSHIEEIPRKDNTIIQTNHNFSDSQHRNKISNLFSSDEDELDDVMFFSTKESYKKNIKNDRTISNSTKLIKNNEHYESKVEMYDSSSNEDIFNTNKSRNNFNSSKSSKISDLNKIKNVENVPNNDHAVINQVKKTEDIDISPKENNITDKKKTNLFSLLSDDEKDDDLFFNNISYDSMNVSTTSNTNEFRKVTSSSSFLSPQIDHINEDIFHNSSFKNVFDGENQNTLNKKELNMSKNETFSILKESKIQYNKSTIISSSNDEKILSLSSNIQNENYEKETDENHEISKSSSENLLDDKNEESSENNLDVPNSDTSLTSNKNNTQPNKLAIHLISDEHNQLSFNSDIQNKNSIAKSKLIFSTSDSEESLKDFVDGSSLSSLNARNETTTKIPGKLSKNAGAFIKVAALLPKSKNQLTISDIPRSVSLDERNYSLPTSAETKLFSIEKERAKIQVKRRPQSRKARIAAARISSLDNGYESNFQESSRLFGSTSDLVNYQSIPILFDDVKGSSNEFQNEDNINDNNEKIETMNESNQKKSLQSSDDNSNVFQSIDKDICGRDCSSNQENKFDEQKLEFKSVHEQLQQSESVHEKCSEIEPFNEKIDIFENKFKALSVKELEEYKSKSINENTNISEKPNFLLDDILISATPEKLKKQTFNIFDSDDEIEYNQKFTKKNLVKNKSIFGDDSDDDLFSISTPSISSACNLPSKKTIEKSNQQQSRSSADGYVKLTAESVAINPLEPKKN